MSQDMTDGFGKFPIFLSFVASAVIIVSLFISKLVRHITIARISNTNAQDHTKIPLANASKKSSHQSQSYKSNEKKYKGKYGKDGKLFLHRHWVLTSLKGHSSNIPDMEFSPHGKFLVTCGEEETDQPDPGGRDVSADSSGSEGNKENDISPKALLSRKQKKTRGRKEDLSLVTNKMTRKAKRSDASGSKRWNPSNSRHPRNYFKSNISDDQLFAFFKNYVLTPQQMMDLGYPIESSLYPGRAIIFKVNSPRGPIELSQTPRPSHPFDVNAREFVPSCDAVPPKWKSCSERNDWNTSEKEKVGENLEGGESGESKSVFKSDDDRPGNSDMGEDKCICKESSRSENVVRNLLTKEPPRSEEKRCVRCGRGFFVMVDGEYLTQEKCVYHWGKLQKVFEMNSFGEVFVKNEFSCCNGKKNSKGCTTARLHVWNGVAAGVNGPLEGYVKTKPRKSCDGDYGVYSMDCEMCYTTQGLELTKITIVATDGRTVYESFVKPENAIIDYNTRFSGITAKDLKKGNSAKCLKDVQNDLMNFINADTILIGHALENDLKALKMIHSTIIDTSIIFPHYYGLPYRRSLRSLVNSFLKRDIQSYGHDSFEDARACMELMLWKVKKDFRNNFDQKSNSFMEKL